MKAMLGQDGSKFLSMDSSFFLSEMATTCCDLKETSKIFIGDQHGQASRAMARVADAGLSLPGEKQRKFVAPGAYYDLPWGHNSSTSWVIQLIQLVFSTKNCAFFAPGVSRR